MKEYLHARRRVIAAYLLFTAVYGIVSWLGRVPAGAAVYAGAICTVLALGWGVWDFICFRRKQRLLEKLREEPEINPELLPEPDNAVDEGYSELIRALILSRAELRKKYEAGFRDMSEYYTLWAHQIKTPISSMRLALADSDTPVSRELSVELQRVEQYVEMVLCYIRLEEGGSDLVIRECQLDELIRAALRKFSPQFIRKKLTLDYTPSGASVLTDEKWLLFVIEQVLSNALKYTKTGGISITFSGGILTVRDTGIGIAPEDLPRIFEKGYTGCNGRRDMKASGIGLYLCRRVCRMLGHGISAESGAGGTAVSIDLSRENVDLRE